MKRFTLILFLLAAALAAYSWAAILEEGKSYGPEYYSKIKGEIYGQAAPGVQSVTVNGRALPIDKGLNFRTTVVLKKGERYLTIKTRYQGLIFTKKYLVIRHPKAQKTFTLALPSQAFQQIIAKKKAPETATASLFLKEKSASSLKSRSKLPTVKASTPAIVKPPVKHPVFSKYEYVAELAPGRFLVIRKVNAKYFALLYDQKTKIWIPLNELSLQEFKDLLNKGTIPLLFDP